MGSLWMKGISHVANDEGYRNAAHPVKGEYSVELDLSDLGSNEGKVLYDDGENQIYVSNVIVNNESDYEVYFRSSGTFSLGGATLVSGTEYVRENNSFTDNFQAKAQAKYKGETYQLHYSGYSGLNYRDGDEFGFYLSRPDEEIIVDSEVDPIIEVTISNLYINYWVKKL